MRKPSKFEITLYTDGACRGNPGPGGWAYTIHLPDGRKWTKWGKSKTTTNNRMELEAVIRGMQRLVDDGFAGRGLLVVSDSKYVLCGMDDWMFRWEKNGWIRNGGPVLNLTQWKRLRRLVDQFDMGYQHVPGHSGHPENELCDAMANRAIDRLVSKERKNG